MKAFIAEVGTTCDTDVIDEFKEILTDLNITPAQWFTIDEYDREDLFPEE